MKIIGILHNDITDSDFAVNLKDNYPDDTGLPSTPPRNSAKIAHTKSDMPVLQIQFWRNEKFKKYFWFGEKVWVSQDEDTDFVKCGSQWLEFLEIYNSF
jgi:hypothetical protein